MCKHICRRKCFNTRTSPHRVEALRLLRTNSIKELFELKKKQFLTRLLERGYPKCFAEDILTEMKFSMRNTALQNKLKTSKKMIPSVTTFNPATPNLKKKHWHLIAGNHNLAQIFPKSPNGCLPEGQVSETRTISY